MVLTLAWQMPVGAWHCIDGSEYRRAVDRPAGATPAAFPATRGETTALTSRLPGKQHIASHRA